MKILAAMGVLQIVAIILLYGKLVEIDGNLSRAVVTQPATATSAGPTTAPTPQNVVSPGSLANEDKLRQIIREELTAQLGDSSRQDLRAELPVAQASVNQFEIEQQREFVIQQLDYYSSVGNISDPEMQKLQMDIAKLDAAGRTEMLRELNRALNSGRLKGRL